MIGPLVTEPFPLQGLRVLLAAEYIGQGGTRTYFRELIDFYHRSGAHVVAITTFAENDDDMRRFVESRGFEIFSFAYVARRFDSISHVVVPTVWDLRAHHHERRLFTRLCREWEIDRVVISVGTSGLLLSATHARPGSMMIAHGYPHGRRQDSVGKFLMPRLMPADMTLVTVSDYSRDLFRRKWDLDKHSINSLTIRSTCGPIQARTSRSTKDSLVLTAALMDPHKEPEVWLKVANPGNWRDSGNAVQFQWIGDGPLLALSRAQSQVLGLPSSTFPGWVEEPSSHYEQAMVYLQTSSIESLGLSVVDALRHGVPCVVTNAGGLPEVVVDGVNGFVVPVGNVRQMTEAIRLLLKDHETWNRFSRAGQRMYEERFSPQTWRDSLIQAHLRRAPSP